MLYYLFEYLEKEFQLPGASLFGFLTFRAAVAIILSLLISTIFGKRIIKFLQKQQVGETIRDLGLEGQVEKAGTPTMGGIIIILATLIPVLLLAKLENIYIILLLITTLWMGVIGFIDDYIKKFKNDKDGLKGARIGVIKDFYGFDPNVDKLLNKQHNLMLDNGAELIKVECTKNRKEWGDAEWTVLLYELKYDMNKYLSEHPNVKLKTLADIIEFNKANADTEMPWFGHRPDQSRHRTMLTGLEDRQCGNNCHEDPGEQVSNFKYREPTEPVGLPSRFGCCPH